MKRIGALVCLIMMMVSVMAPATFATEDANAQKTGFAIVDSIPHNKDEGVSVENLSVKIYFNQDVMPANDKIEKKNAKQFKLTDKDGKNVPIKVYYSDKEEGLLMVVSNVRSKEARKTNSVIQGNTKYTLTISEKFQATDGSKLGEAQEISFKTLDQQKSTTVYMILMAVMMVGMVVFTSKSAKKEAEKQSKESGKSQTVNPYKEAKRTGKSVEEIVAKDKERKAKEAEAYAKKKAAEAELMAELEAEAEAEAAAASNKRVSGPKPIAAAGSEYKVKVVKTQPKKSPSTNPKNQSGKKKNSKGKK